MAVVGILETLVAILCFLVLYRWCSIKKSPVTNWPLLGMLPAIIGNIFRIHDWVADILRQTRNTFEFKGPWFTNMNYLITSDPENIRHTFIKNPSNFLKGPAFKSILEVLGDGIFIAESDSWKSQRKLTQSAMKHTSFQLLLVKITQRKVETGLFSILENASEQGTEVDLQDLFQRFTFDTTCRLLIGFDPCCLSVEFPDVPAVKAFDQIEEVLLYRHAQPESCWKLQKWLQIGQEKKLTRAWETLDNFLAQHIPLRGAAEQEEGEYSDLLTSYAQEAELTGAFKITDKFLRDTVVNLLLAGRDTISAAITWFFWLVATNPSVEINILEEMKAILKEKQDEKWVFFSATEVNKLVYLHGALCESLRLYPSVPLNHKDVVQPDILPSGHRVDQNTKMLFSLYSTGRMEEIWGEDCLEFKPQRWITERGGIKYVPSYKFIAFNAGPRSCLGKEISFVQMKIIATAVLYRFHVQVVEGHPVSPSNSIILHMKHGLKVRVSKRHV